jgi:hypothetical protein
MREDVDRSRGGWELTFAWVRYAEALLTVNATQEDGAKGLQSMRHRRRHNQGFACAITTAPGARSSGREMGKRASRGVRGTASHIPRCV